METHSHLWAVGYDDIKRAEEVGNEIRSMGWGSHYLFLLDLAVVVRNVDGSFTCNREPFPTRDNILGTTAVGFLAGLVVGAPFTGATVGALAGAIGSATATSAIGIGDDFIREVEGLMRPGTSALFVLDDEGQMDVILHRLRGLGGTVLKTNVDLERAKLIQATLAEMK
ncbi:MAG TPA: DUF1269 domain-containing protein [Myxococcota bacterium]|nr:DUF1269 domain-containing protein [Myxococcota bacterium]